MSPLDLPVGHGALRTPPEISTSLIVDCLPKAGFLLVSASSDGEVLAFSGSSSRLSFLDSNRLRNFGAPAGVSVAGGSFSEGFFSEFASVSPGLSKG